jgi:hypothetical protein
MTQTTVNHRLAPFVVVSFPSCVSTPGANLKVVVVVTVHAVDGGGGVNVHVVCLIVSKC